MPWRYNEHIIRLQVIIPSQSSWRRHDLYVLSCVCFVFDRLKRPRVAFGIKYLIRPSGHEPIPSSGRQTGHQPGSIGSLNR